jgi:hypothetical protein
MRLPAAELGACARGLWDPHSKMTPVAWTIQDDDGRRSQAWPWRLCACCWTAVMEIKNDEKRTWMETCSSSELRKSQHVASFFAWLRLWAPRSAVSSTDGKQRASWPQGAANVGHAARLLDSGVLVRVMQQSSWPPSLRLRTADEDGEREDKVIRTYNPLFLFFIHLSHQDSLLYTYFSRTHSSSISFSIYCGAHLSLYLNITMYNIF